MEAWGPRGSLALPHLPRSPKQSEKPPKLREPEPPHREEWGQEERGRALGRGEKNDS